MEMSFREDGVQLYEEGRYASALEMFLAEDINPAEDSELSYYMGLCHARLGETDDAMRLLGLTFKTDTNLARIYQSRMLFSWLLVEQGEIEQAEHSLREVLQQGFESPQAWAALGYCQWRRDRRDLALESYRKAVELDRENSNAANGLGYLLAEIGEDPEEAVELCRRAVEADSHNTAYLDSLGWALFRAGRPAEAVRYLTEALSNSPEDGTIRSHLEAIRTHEQSDRG